jgi:hypothetical protein
MSIPNNVNYYLQPVIAIPSALTITGITQANPMVITVSSNSDQMNTYIPGQKIKLNVPVTYGMIQANGLTPQILMVNGQQIAVNVNSLNFDPFVIPPTGSLGPATIAPFGSQNLQFSNITNQIAFQSLNNTGN